MLRCGLFRRPIELRRFAISSIGVSEDAGPSNATRRIGPDVAVADCAGIAVALRTSDLADRYPAIGWLTSHNVVMHDLDRRTNRARRRSPCRHWATCRGSRIRQCRRVWSRIATSPSRRRATRTSDLRFRPSASSHRFRRRAGPPDADVRVRDGACRFPRPVRAARTCL